MVMVLTRQACKGGEELHSPAARERSIENLLHQKTGSNKQALYATYRYAQKRCEEKHKHPLVCTKCIPSNSKPQMNPGDIHGNERIVLCLLNSSKLLGSTCRAHSVYFTKMS